MSKSAKDRNPPRFVATSGARVQRYFPGKVPEGRVGSISASESEDEKDNLSSSTHPQEIAAIAITDLEANSSFLTKQTNPSLDSSDVDSGDGESDIETKRLLHERLRDRQLTDNDEDNSSESDSDRNDDYIKAYSESQMQKHDVEQIPTAYIHNNLSQGALSSDNAYSRVHKAPSEATSGSSDTDSSESSGEDSHHILLKPVFVSKPQRQLNYQSNNPPASNTDGAEYANGSESSAYVRQEQRELSVRMAAEVAARARQQPDTDDADELDVDDTDDVDVEAEFEAWQLREHARIERDRKEKEEVDAEEEERVRIQNMTEEEKNRDGFERARTQHQQKARERAEQIENNPGKNKTETAMSAHDKMDQGMLEYALHRSSNNRKSNSKWRGYKREDTSSRRSLWDKGV
ncbi:hypothetical protein IWW48_004517 [Coemansia sp. RSA 1200]|nr:hypothetical protein IWW48_004517 [Coemansia sp. RSA 1200]